MSITGNPNYDFILMSLGIVLGLLAVIAWVELSSYDPEE